VIVIVASAFTHCVGIGSEELAIDGCLTRPDEDLEVTHERKNPGVYVQTRRICKNDAVNSAVSDEEEVCETWIAVRDLGLVEQKQRRAGMVQLRLSFD
jgi:hypothetical protein